MMLPIVLLLAALAPRAAALPEPVPSPAPAAQSWHYAGPHHAEVRYLLSRVQGWSVPSCAACSDGATPELDIEQSCSRDASVAAAVMYAWAAESYAAVGQAANARQHALTMRETLNQVDGLCSPGTPTFGGGEPCATDRVWPCPSPM
jgi:hypothetical protein